MGQSGRIVSCSLGPGSVVSGGGCQDQSVSFTGSGLEAWGFIALASMGASIGFYGYRDKGFSGLINSNIAQ